MSEADYEELVIEIHDQAFNEGNYEPLYEYIDEDCVWMGDSEIAISAEGMEDYIRRLRSAFPDLTETIENVWVDDDISVFRFTRTGTFENELVHTGNGGSELTFEPTGEEFSYSGVVIDRWENGKIVEGAGYEDQLGLFIQLEILPDLSEFTA